MIKALRLGRRLENAVRGAPDPLFRSVDPDQTLSFVVVGCQVFVCDGPIFTVAVEASPAEVVVRESERDSTVVVRASTDNARARPGEFRRSRSAGVGFLVAPAKSVWSAEPCSAARQPQPAVLDLVGPNVLQIVIGRVKRGTGLEQSDLRSGITKNLGRHAAGRARADDDNIVDFSAADDLRHHL